MSGSILVFCFYVLGGCLLASCSCSDIGIPPPIPGLERPKDGRLLSPPGWQNWFGFGCVYGRRGLLPGESIAKDKDMKKAAAIFQKEEGIRAPMLYYPPDCPGRFCGKHGLRECETLAQGQMQLGCDSTPGLSSPCSLPPEALCASSCPRAAPLPHEAASILLSVHGSKSPKVPSVTQPWRQGPWTHRPETGRRGFRGHADCSQPPEVRKEKVQHGGSILHRC